VIVVPVFADGRVVFSLGLGLSPDRFTTLLARQHIPDRWTISIADAAGVRIATLGTNHRVGEPIPPDSPILQSNLPEGWARAVREPQGTPFIAAWSRIPPQGWLVVVSIPEQEIVWPALRSQLLSIVAAAVVLVFGLLLAALIARRIAGPIASLSRFAATGEGEEMPALPKSGLREVDRVAKALQQAALRRRLAEAELTSTLATLEDRVQREVAMRHAAQTQALHAQKMSALGQLAGGVAHDMNNVMQAVSGALGLIQRATEASAVQRFARLGAEAADRGTAIVRRLLAFSHQTELNTEPVDAAGLVRELAEILQHTLGSVIVVRTELPLDFPAVLTDKLQLETVLINLATNARDAMPDGGTITLRVLLVTIAPDQTDEAQLPAGDYVRFEVSDTGSGMDAATLTRATEPFFTTKLHGKGTGLGLAMAQGFAEQCGGRLSIASVPGEGTTVTVWLPRVADTQPPPAAAGRATPTVAQPHDATRLLLVDDDAAVRELLSRQLQESGYTVVEATDTESALGMLTTMPPDVLISDLAMPGRNGLELILAARRLYPSIRAVLLTGHAGDAMPLLRESGMALAGFALVHKPISGEQLAAEIAVLLSQCVAEAELALGAAPVGQARPA
jgi:signal transduction histidine kinase/AmiR/NasT family two-component response regulator